MLIIRNPTNVFDTDEIQRGTLIYAKHKSWSVGEQGFVVSVVKDKVTVQYPPQTIVRYPEEGAEDELDKSDL